MKAYNCVKLNQVTPKGMAILPLEDISGPSFSVWADSPCFREDGVHIYSKTSDWDDENYGFIANESL